MAKKEWKQVLDWSAVRPFFSISDAYTAICELLDNSLAAGALEIRINLDDDSLTITDCKGHGMDERELQDELLRWGREKPVDVLRFFGGGGKGAWGYLARDITLLSTPKSLEATYILQLPNFQERTLRGDVAVEVESKPAQFSVPTVRIEMRGLKVKIDLAVLYKRIANTYASALRQGVQIIIKRRERLLRKVKPIDLPIEVIKIVDRKTKDGKGAIIGELGLKTKDTVTGGIRCYQGTIGRLICRDTFGFEEERDINLDRVIGFLDNDFVPFTVNKDSFQKGTKEYEEFYTIAREEMQPIINLVRKEVLAPVDIEKALPQVERQINKIMQDLDWPLSAHGEKTPQSKKVFDLLITHQERRREKGEIKHPSQPKDTDRGIRQRKGGIRLHLEPNADSSIRSRCEISDLNIYHIYINSEFPGMKATYYEGQRTKATDNWEIESAAQEVARYITSSVDEFKRLVDEVMARTGS